MLLSFTRRICPLMPQLAQVQGHVPSQGEFQASGGGNAVGPESCWGESSFACRHQGMQNEGGKNQSVAKVKWSKYTIHTNVMDRKRIVNILAKEISAQIEVSFFR